MEMFRLNRKVRLVAAIIFIGSFTGMAQIAPVEDFYTDDFEQGTNFKDINNVYDKFLGTWIYNNGIDYFKITFSKQEDFDYDYWGTNPTTFDIITSNFEYKKNGVTIYNTYTNPSFHPSSFPYKYLISGYNFTNSSGISLVGNRVKNTNELFISYSEPTTLSVNGRCRGAAVKIAYSDISINSNIPTLNWERVFERVQDCRGRLGAADGDDSDFVIPPNMVLTKQ